MLERICAHIHNYFTEDANGDAYHKEAGTFTISGGTLELPFLVDGCYFLVSGSRFNDGVFKYPADDLVDETFTGTVSEMRPPRAFLKVVDEIAAWDEKYGATMASPYTSESVQGVYSYAKAAADGSGSSADAWQGAFRARLNEWRKIR